MRSEGLIVPPPTMLVRKLEYLGVEVVIATVLPSDSPLVRYRGLIHVRISPR